MIVELVIALIFSYGLNGHIYKEEKNHKMIAKRMMEESPRSLVVVKVCYALIFIESVVGPIARFFGM